MTKEEIKFKKGQVWKEKNGKKILQIMAVASGNRHWTIQRLDRKTKHSHIHEGTLLKYYDPNK